MLIKRFLCLLSVVVLCGLGGCQLYINVPSEAGDWARNNPNISDVRVLEQLAISGVLLEVEGRGQVDNVKDLQIEGLYGVRLPKDSYAASYRQVLAGLPQGVVAVNGMDLDTINSPRAVAQANAKRKKAQLQAAKTESQKGDTAGDTAPEIPAKVTPKKDVLVLGGAAMGQTIELKRLLEVVKIRTRAWDGWVIVTLTQEGIKRTFEVRFKYNGYEWLVQRVRAYYLGE